MSLHTEINHCDVDPFFMIYLDMGRSGANDRAPLRRRIKVVQDLSRVLHHSGCIAQVIRVCGGMGREEPDFKQIFQYSH
jgi:hypothetical protein